MMVKAEKQLIKELGTAHNLDGQHLTGLTGQSFKPFRLLMVIAVSIFLAETFVMFLLFLLPPLSRLLEALVDGLLLSVVISPILYRFSFRPLFIHAAERKQIEEEGKKLLLAYKEQNQIISSSNLELEKALARTKQAEGELRSSEQRFRKLFDESNDAVFIHDFEGTILDVNRRACDMLGYPKDKLLEMLIPALFPKEELPASKKASGIIREKGAVRFESKFKRADGTVINVDINSRVIDSEGGIVQGIARDNTELKKAEEQLQQSKVLASLGEMTAGIAHEVNNPLGIILLYSELLLKDDVSRRTKKDLKIVHDEAKRAARIMTDLLTYSSSGVKFQRRRLNLYKIIKKVLEMRRYEERVQNISVSANLLGDPLCVRGDSSQLMQVFMNLILNAEDVLKESKDGKIIISAQTDGEWAKVSIADNGIGIPGANLSQVFHPFFSTKNIGESTGLGLSTCYGIITAHGGLIRAENNEMGGATFIVELPLAKARRQGSLLQKTKKVSLVIA